MQHLAKKYPLAGRLAARMSAYEQPWGLGLLTQADPHPHIAQLVGEEICTVARRIVEVCQRHGANVSFMANQYTIRRSSCATTLIGTTKQQHLDSAPAAAEEPIDEEMLAYVVAAVEPDRGRHWMSGLPHNNCALHA